MKSSKYPEAFGLFHDNFVKFYRYFANQVNFFSIRHIKSFISYMKKEPGDISFYCQYHRAPIENFD